MNKSLQRGYILLTVILLVVVAVMLVLKPKQKKVVEAIDTMAAYEDSLVARYERKQEERKREYASRRSERARYQERTYTSGNQYEPREWVRDTLVRENAYRARPALVFDLNEADTIDLQQLHGIGPVFARRIVRYRERLGGYVNKEQLMEVYGMTDTLYNKISPYLTLEHPSVKKMNLNTATLDELKRHPYLDYYKARAIVLHRDKCGRFNSREDLLKVSLIDAETYQRLQPYLEL